MNVKLWDVEQTLEDLMDQGAQAELDGDHEAALVFYQQLDEYLTRESAKVTSYVGLIRSREATVAAAKLERDRIDGIMKRAQADVDRMKATALAVMQRFDVKELSAELNGHKCGGLRRQVSGGAQALEVDNDRIPMGLREVTVKMTGDCFAWLVKLIEEFKPRALHPLLEYAIQKATDAPDNQRIREALKQRVVCPICGGVDMSKRPCERCNDEGTVQATIPGAKLLERGEHVRVI